MREHRANWSRVCAAAIAAKLEEIDRDSKATLSDDAVVTRLLATKSDDQVQDETLGFNVGVRWAKTRARWRELESLERAHPKRASDLDATEWLWSAIGREGHPTPDEIQELFDRPPTRVSQSLANGFVTGALAVFRDVQKQIAGGAG